MDSGTRNTVETSLFSFLFFFFFKIFDIFIELFTILLQFFYVLVFVHDVYVILAP